MIRMTEGRLRRIIREVLLEEAVNNDEVLSVALDINKVYGNEDYYIEMEKFSEKNGDFLKAMNALEAVAKNVDSPDDLTDDVINNMYKELLSVSSLVKMSEISNELQQIIQMLYKRLQSATGRGSGVKAAKKAPRARKTTDYVYVEDTETYKADDPSVDKYQYACMGIDEESGRYLVQPYSPDLSKSLGGVIKLKTSHRLNAILKSTGCGKEGKAADPSDVIIDSIDGYPLSCTYEDGEGNKAVDEFKHHLKSAVSMAMGSGNWAGMKQISTAANNTSKTPTQTWQYVFANIPGQAGCVAGSFDEAATLYNNILARLKGYGYDSADAQRIGSSGSGVKAAKPAPGKKSQSGLVQTPVGAVGNKPGR